MPPVPGLHIVSDPVYDVRPEQYPTVLREMIRHENDVTNHRIMWLLIGQGFIANAFVSLKNASALAGLLFSFLGVLVALSAFVMLYQGYLARGYLQFLGQQAKQGTLQEQYLPLVGWPSNRIRGWSKHVWVCRWFRQTRDLLEPWLVLPYVFTSLWMISPLNVWTRLNTSVLVLLSVSLSAAILSAFCIVLVWSQRKDENGSKFPAHFPRSKADQDPVE
jgi:hypothetical protein